MSSLSKPQASNTLLHNCWQTVTHQSALSSSSQHQHQYIAQDKVLQWLNRVIAQSGHMEQLAKHTIGTKEMLNQYMKQVHKLDHHTVANVKWTYQQAVELYYFVHQQITQHNQPVKQNNQSQQVQHKAIHQNKSIKNQSKVINNESKVINNKSKIMNNECKISQNDKSPANKSKIEHSPIKASKQLQKSQQLKPNKQQNMKQSKQIANKSVSKQEQQQQQQQKFMYPANTNKSTNQHQSKTQPKQLQPQQQQAAQQQQQQQQDDNEFAQDIPKHLQNNNKENAKEGQVTKNYRQYLLTIFQHYCRMSYSTGNDPTFQQIQHKTTVMHINKFMIFCKEFGIAKLNNMNRNVLVEMFKKNAQYFKQMNYQQFVQVLIKISKIVYGHGQDQQQNTNQQYAVDAKQGQNNKGDKQSSKQFEQLLLFLEVNNFAAFKKKIQSLNIKFKPKVSKQNEPKKIEPTNYKFKFAPSTDGKSQEQVRQQLQERKRIRSQNKLKVVNQINRPKNISSKKDLVKRQAQQRNINDRQQIQTTQPTRKQLAPPLPPARKISNSSNNNNRPVQDPTAGVTGYANIHRLKLLGKQGQVDSKMKLNTVVQQAKRMMQLNNNVQQYSQYPVSNRMPSYGRETPYSMHQHMEEYSDRDMTQSEQSSYSQRDLLAENPISRRSYAPYGHSQLEKRGKLDRSKSKGKHEDDDQKQKEELLGLIGDDDDDRDEYLQEHLNRQKKNGIVNQRIEKKIKEFEIKHTRN